MYAKYGEDFKRLVLNWPFLPIGTNPGVFESVNVCLLLLTRQFWLSPVLTRLDVFFCKDFRTCVE